MKPKKVIKKILQQLTIKSSFLIILLGFVFAGCEKESSCSHKNESCLLTIYFNTYSKTKSGLIPENILDINLLVFDQNQQLIKKVYLNNQLSTTLQINFGEKTIAAIANVGNIDFSQCNTLTQLRNSKHSSILGTQGNTIFSGEVTKNFTLNNKNITIPLTRMVSKITYLFDKSNLDKDVNITIQKIQLKNTPTECSYLASNIPNSSQIATNGDVLEGSNTEPTSHNSATPLYMFENMQGTIGANSNPRLKHPGSKENQCTFVEITASYSSPAKTGTIKYRNFIGLNTTNNYDIVRGKHYKETIVFNGSSINENSWRVDVSDLHDVPPPTINVTGISISDNSLQLINGNTHQLESTIYPTNATNKERSWSSSNPSVVSVNPTTGKLTTHSYGTAIITVKSTDGPFEDYCTVNVYDQITLYVGTHELPEYNPITNQKTSAAVTLYLRANLTRQSNMTIINAIAQHVSVNITYSYKQNGTTYTKNGTLTLDNIQNNDYPHNSIGGNTQVIFFEYSHTEEELLAAINSISIEVTPGNVYVQNWYVTW